MNRFRAISAATLALLLAAPVAAQTTMPPRLDSTWMEAFEWRSIGPANMLGRVTDIEGIPSPSATFYVAPAAGGVWKTTNDGTTFRPLFTDERVAAMGDLAIAPSDTMQIWAGTGEEDSRNSISPGRGIYKSTDGGVTWELKGLEGTEHIARIVVHPTNPDIVWVAALGPLWREGGDRGLYKTTDGGDTWRLVKSVSDRAGFVDVAIQPGNPNVLLASSWERIRGPYYLQSGGPGSALWKSTDGGESWTEVTGNGFPETELGRIDVAFAPSRPSTVYAEIEAAAPDSTADDPEPEALSGLYRSQDGGTTWERMNDFNSRPFYYNQVRVDPANPDRVYFSSLRFSDDGGKTMRNAAQEVHVDFHAMWIDPNDGNHLVVGNDGGIAISHDQGGNYLFPNIFPIGQFYAVSYDMGKPYRVCGGLQDNYSWCGPSRKTGGAITNHDWFSVSGGDGFVTQQDPRDPNIVYSESQGGNMGRSNLATGERTRLGRPSWQEPYRLLQDSIAMLWPDSTELMPPESQARIEALQRRASADSAALELRYNWNTPFFLSPHNPDVLYAGANRVLKSTNRGDTLVPISPDLSRQDTMKIRVSTQTTGGITPDVTGAETFATIVSLNESPLVRGLLYAGTDDGNLWMSPDDGGTWNDITANTTSLVPDGTYVSRIEPSSHVANRVYVTFDNHRRGDFTPYVLVSEDRGSSFHSIASDLPDDGPDFAHVIREDPVNADLLYLGTDVGVYVSLDRGLSWQRFMQGLPTVPVRDLKIHPRDHELIAGTHGRSIWIVDVAPLQQLDAQVLASDVHLFEPSPAYDFGMPPTGGEFTAQAYFQAPTPGGGAEIRYWLGDATDDSVKVEIADASGNVMQTLNGSSRKGMNSVSWQLRTQPERLPLSPSERRDSLAMEKRFQVVADSFVNLGEDRQEVEDVLDGLRQGGGGFSFRGRGGGGGGGGGSQAWDARPAEGPPLGGGQGGGPGGRQGGPGGQGEQSLQQRINQAVRPQTGGRRGGFGFGGGGLFPSRFGESEEVSPGTYTVTLRVGDRSYTTELTVLDPGTYGSNQ